LLVLGSYGSPQDIGFLLELLKRDANAQFTGHITEAIRRVLVRAPDKVSDADLEELRNLSARFLSVWANPLAVNVETGCFHRTVCVIKMLCARLEQQDVDVALHAVVTSQSRALAKVVLDKIRQTVRDLEAVGQRGWIAHKSSVVQMASLALTPLIK
jgi:hypothetical protein